MSLRSKYLIFSGLAIVLPLLGYLLLDALLTRSLLIRDEARSLRLSAEVLQSAIHPCQGRCTHRARELMDTLAAIHPELDVMLIDRHSQVLAATRPDKVGRRWEEEVFAAFLDGSTDYAWDTMQHDGEPVLDVTVPWIGADGAVLGVVHVARSLKAVEEEIGTVEARHTAFVIGLTLLVGLIFTFVLWKLVTRVERFNEELAREVERTRAELTAAQQELVKAEQMATMGKLSGGLAHELRNPLFIVRGSAQAIRRKAPEVAEYTDDIMQEVDRVDTILARLIELARPIEMERRPIVLDDLMADVVDRSQRALPDCACADLVQVEIRDSGLMVNGDASYLRQAFLNLVGNACDAVDAEGHVLVVVSAAGPGRALVEVQDDGKGIQPEDAVRIFEPFFTRKPAGAGLGLCATKKVLDLHGAVLSFASQPGQGTTFRVEMDTVDTVEAEA